MIKIYYNSENCVYRRMALDNGNLPESITESGDYHTLEFADWSEARAHADYLLRLALKSKNPSDYQIWRAVSLKELAEFYD